MLVRAATMLTNVREALLRVPRAPRSFRAILNEVSTLLMDVTATPGLSVASTTIVGVKRDELIVARSTGDRIDIVANIPRDEMASQALDTALREAWSGPFRDVALELDDSVVLKPSLRLPKASRRTLRGAVAYEVARLTPVDPAQLLYDFTLRDKEKDGLHIDIALRMVQRPFLLEVLSLCHSVRASVGAITFSNDDIEADWRRFPVDRPAWLRMRWQRWGDRVLIGLAALLFVAVLAGVFFRASEADAALRDAVSAAADRAAVVEKLEHQITASKADIATLAHKRIASSFVATIADLTNLVPNGTWLTSLSIDGDKIRMQGNSRDASALIGIIDKSGRFANAQFGAPLVRSGSDGTERFDLAFERLGSRRTP